MLELPHAAVGAFIGLKFPNPIIALPLAFASHLLLDHLPHWNPNIYTETKKFGRPTKKTTAIVAFDVLLSLAFGLFVASKVWPDTKHAFVIIACSFLAVAIDVVEGFYFFLGSKNAFLKKVISFQRRHQEKADKFPGILIQVVTVGLVLYFTLSR